MKGLKKLSVLQAASFLKKKTLDSQRSANSSTNREVDISISSYKSAGKTNLKSPSTTSKLVHKNASIYETSAAKSSSKS